MSAKALQDHVTIHEVFYIAVIVDE